MALARAIVTGPRVLFLDEPLSALDLKLRKGMQLELKRRQHELAITFIFVTHDQEEALAMSDRIAVLNQGRIEQIGAPIDIYDRPATSSRRSSSVSPTSSSATADRVGDPAGADRTAIAGCVGAARTSV